MDMEYGFLAAGFCPKNLALARKIMVLPESAGAAAGNWTLQTQKTSDLRHFGHKNVCQKCPDTSIPGPKCLGTLRTWVVLFQATQFWGDLWTTQCVKMDTLCVVNGRPM